MSYGYGIDFTAQEQSTNNRIPEEDFILAFYQHFLQRHEQRGTPPTSDFIIQELDTFIFDERCLVKYKDTKCAVCSELFKVSEEVKKLPCQHLFHSDCIVPWLKLVCSLLCPEGTDSEWKEFVVL
jgi:hypothetical protein